MSRVLPILFNTEMVRANLDGRKGCTRRLVKFLPGENPWWTGYIKDGAMLYNGRNEPCIRNAPYQPGDILYIRETWAWCPCWDCGLDVEKTGCGHKEERVYNAKKKEYGCYMYRASCEDNEYPSADIWHPSIHMPKEAARIWLRVTDVRVERLQDITIDDIRREGLSSVAVHAGDMEIALEEWKMLWNSTVKKPDIDRYGWDANPYVFVIDFIKTEKPEIRF